jgi:hypothetical protein
MTGASTDDAHGISRLCWFRISKGAVFCVLFLRLLLGGGFLVIRFETGRRSNVRRAINERRTKLLRVTKKLVLQGSILLFLQAVTPLCFVVLMRT